MQSVMAIGGNVGKHDDAAYVTRQSKADVFVAEANFWLFRKFIRPGDVVIDVGCSGGLLPDALACGAKIGREIDPAARDATLKMGLRVVSDLSEFGDECADIVISNHALEHAYDPFGTVKLVLNKLKPGGLAVFVVPCERHDTRYVEQNTDQHLYTWAPINLGNLFRHAGFTIEACERVAYRWPPKADLVQRLVGWPLFHALSRLHARLRPQLTQVRVVARKPLKS